MGDGTCVPRSDAGAVLSESHWGFRNTMMLTELYY
jgi:hypothetical protein